MSTYEPYNVALPKWKLIKKLWTEKFLESGSKFQDFQFLVEWKIRRRLMRERQTDRQADRQTQTDRQTDRQTEERESNHGEKNYIF